MLSASVVTNQTPQISSKYAIQTALHHWITIFGTPQFLVIDRCTGYTSKKILLIFGLFLIVIRLNVLYTPDGQKVQLKFKTYSWNSSTLIFTNNSTRLSFLTRKFDNAHNTTHFHNKKILPTKWFFTHPCIPLTFPSINTKLF